MLPSDNEQRCQARVSLARAAYSDAGIILMDDSLSAVDAHTARQILDNLFLHGPLAGKTRVLVTHALHVLGKADYIHVMKGGAIVERGTYEVRLRLLLDTVAPWMLMRCAQGFAT